MSKKRDNVELPEPLDLHIRSNKYQPTKSEQEEETDMPGMSLRQIGAVFMRPMNIKESE